MPSFLHNTQNTGEAVLSFLRLGISIEMLDRAQYWSTELGKSNLFWDLLNKLLCLKNQRLTMQQVLEHPFW